MSDDVEDAWWGESGLVTAADAPEVHRLIGEPKRRVALNLINEGAPKVDVAKWLNVHRNTINAWAAHPIFVKAQDAVIADVIQSAAARRAKSLVRINHRLGEVLERHGTGTIAALEKSPTSPQAISAVNQLLGTYHRSITTEREVLGLGGKQVTVEHRGGVDHHVSGGLVTVPLREFLDQRRAAVPAEVIAALPENATREELIAVLVTDAVIDGDLIAQLDKEDGEDER